MKRRLLLIALATATLGLTACGFLGTDADSASKEKATDAKVTYPEKSLGKADAPVTIVEYSSMTCPHCATFHAEVLPQLKKKYIETGKARYILREFPLDDLAAAAFMVGRCLKKPEGYFDFIDLLYANQNVWVYGDKGTQLPALQKFAAQAGLSEKDFQTCLKDEKLFSYIKDVRQKGQKDLNITSTPSFVINGKKLEGVSLKAFEDAIDPLLK